MIGLPVPWRCPQRSAHGVAAASAAAPCYACVGCKAIVFIAFCAFYLVIAMVRIRRIIGAWMMVPCMYATRELAPGLTRL